MATRSTSKSKVKKPLDTTLGKVPPHISKEEPFDISQLQKPIHTSVFGLKQVLTLFHTATDEVKKYVSYECDIMYECRICRSIFRSLANFILHKRKYCQERFSDHKNWKDEEESELDVHPVPEDREKASFNQSKSSGRMESKTISVVLDNLLNKQRNAALTEEVLNSTPTASKHLPSRENNDKSIALTMERIKGCDQAIFQTMHKNLSEEFSKSDLMKSEVMEIHSILEQDEAILGPDGKIIQSNKSPNYLPKNDLICTVCNQKFATKKTLTFHIKYKHNKSRLVYPCPECKETLSNTWCVFRHLCKVHRKTSSEIKKLRSLIHDSAIIKEQESNTRRSSGSHLRLRSLNAKEAEDQNNQQWMDDFESANDLQMCGGCGRRFERKAALHSHSQICLKRIALCNSIKENNKTEDYNDKEENKASQENTQKRKRPEHGLKGAERRKPSILRRNYKSIIQERRDYVESRSALKRTPNEIITIDDDDEDEEENRTRVSDSSENSNEPKDIEMGNSCDTTENLRSKDFVENGGLENEAANLPEEEEEEEAVDDESKQLSTDCEVISSTTDVISVVSSVDATKTKLLQEEPVNGNGDDNLKRKRIHSEHSTEDPEVKIKKIPCQEVEEKAETEQKDNANLDESTLSKQEDRPNMQDPVVRKMVLEVIFGPAANNCESSGECMPVNDFFNINGKAEGDSNSNSNKENNNELHMVVKNSDSCAEKDNRVPDEGNKNSVESVSIDINSLNEINNSSDVSDVSNSESVTDGHCNGTVDDTVGVIDVLSSSKANVPQRPVRSRTTALHKDFLYEMAQNKSKTVKVSDTNSNSKKRSLK